VAGKVRAQRSAREAKASAPSKQAPNLYAAAASPRGRKAAKPERDVKEGSKETRREAKNARPAVSSRSPKAASRSRSSRSPKEAREPALTYEKTQEQLMMEEAMRQEQEG